MTDTLNGLQYAAFSTVRTAGGASVIDGITQVPRYPVTATIDGVAASTLLIDAGTGHRVIGARFTLAAFDQIDATDYLANGVLTRAIAPGEILPMSFMLDGSDGNITDVDGMVLTDDSSIGDGQVTNVNQAAATAAVASICPEGTTQAQLLATPSGPTAHYLHWQISNSAACRDGFISLQPAYDTAGRYCYLTLEVRGYA